MAFEVVSAVQWYKKKHNNRIPTIDELYKWLVYFNRFDTCQCPICKPE